MKIGLKLILGFLTVILLVVLAGYLSSHASQKALQQSIGENLTLLSTKVLEEIDRDIAQRIEVFQTYTQSLLLQQMLIASNQEFQQFGNVQAYIDEKNSDWIAAPEGNLTLFMQKMLSNRISQELQKKINSYEKRNGYRVYGEIIVTNRYGANVAQTARATDYRQDDELWWQVAREKELYVGDVNYDDSAGIHSLDIGIRVDDDAGNFLGVMKVILNIEDIIIIIRDVEGRIKYETAQFKLLTREGRLIYSTGVFKFLSDVSMQLKSSIGYGLQGQQRYFEIRYFPEDNKKKLFAYAQSRGHKSFKGLGWVLIISYDTQEIFAPVKELRNHILILSMIITAFALLMGVIIASSISRNLMQLRNAAAAVGRGDLDTQITITTRDEIAELATSFNKMIRDLKQITASRDDLNREIAERIKIENTLQRVNAELTENEQTLTTMLENLQRAHKELKSTQRQLLHSEKLASIGELAAGIAHEINNPIGFIGSNLSILETYIERISEVMRAMENVKDALSCDDTKKLKKIYKQLAKFEEQADIIYILGDIDSLLRESKEGVERIKKIVMDLKTFSRLDEGVRATADLNAILDGIINIVWNEIKQKAELTRHYSIIPLVQCNTQQIGQVFMNILVNAAQAIEDRGVISIHTYAQDEQVQVEIADTGRGMDEETITKIFDPFFTTKEVGKGTGLGLSISYEIIKKHKGDLQVESEVGKGTKFIISLPT
ncbi:ATP-binding protein [Candidatus Omnitrophota bacterium]